jgi:hypothetical protein
MDRVATCTWYRTISIMKSLHPYTRLSIEYANQRSYLDDLFRVYPTIPEGIRSIDQEQWKSVEIAFDEQDNQALFSALLECDIFPIKDSYIAYFKRDKTAIDRNPRTINRICGRLYEMGLDEIYQRCSEPKETNRQIGPMFKQWLNNKSLGMKPITLDEFAHTKRDAILWATDAEMKDFAQQQCGYHRDKGLDFVARFHGRYIIGEAKFLSDFGGHQNAQFHDAMTTLTTPAEALVIAILDGVLYIPGKNKLHTNLLREYAGYPIMSALVVRDFLYQLS